MKIVVDTNVFISGIFFGGAPSDILSYGENQKFELF
jgi:predicted nucleic acid-binding protein